MHAQLAFRHQLTEALISSNAKLDGCVFIRTYASSPAQLISSFLRLLDERNAALAAAGTKDKWKAVSIQSFDGLSEAALNYSQAYHRVFAVRLLQLPRELRDMIYTHLWTSPWPLHIRSYGMYWGPRHTWTSNCAGPPCTCLRSLPPMVDLNFVGGQVAYECLQSFATLPRAAVRQLVFESSLYTRSVVVRGDVEAFVAGDPFHVGLWPWDVFKKWDLRIKLAGCLYTDEKAWDAVTDQVSSRLDAGIDALLFAPPVESRRDIVFEIEDESGSIAVNIQHVLGIIRRGYRGLRSKGFDVRLEYHNSALFVEWDLGEEVLDRAPGEWSANMHGENRRIDWISPVVSVSVSPAA